MDERVRMSEYDSLADDYSGIIEDLPERRIFGHSLEIVEGDVTGLDVLDLACGTGVFTRRFKHRGARRVVGVDVSEEMLRRARDDERAHPLGIDYVTADVARLGRIGEFDLVTAFALFHYAPSVDALHAMMRGIAGNLRPGGRLTASNMNVVDPATWHNTDRWAQYSLRVGRTDPQLRDGTPVPSTIHWRDVAIPLQLYYFTRETYEQGLHAAGLHDIRWHEPVLPPEYAGDAHWQRYLDHPPLLVLECRRAG